MVIWLFAGGGEAELENRVLGKKGIVDFFEKHFSDYLLFKRITPLKPELTLREKRILLEPGNSDEKKQIKNKMSINGLGRTGKSLAKQITHQLEYYVKSEKDEICDVILVIDDLDCNCQIERTDVFTKAIYDVIGFHDKFKHVKCIIGFASPELESWIIADWNNTIANHLDFRQNQQAMRDWLVENNVSFEQPEKFSSYDAKKECCKEKLSELLIESSKQPIEQFIGQKPYSKGRDTSKLIYEINPEVVAKKCPLFNDFFRQLQNLQPCLN